MKLQREKACLGIPVTLIITTNPIQVIYATTKINLVQIATRNDKIKLTETNILLRNYVYLLTYLQISILFHKNG